MEEEAASGEETEVASVAVSIVAAEASEAVTVDLADHQTRRADRVADTTATVETTVETAGAAAADTVDATTTEDTAAEAASAEAIDPAPGVTPCRLVKGTAETETEVETVVEIVAEIETETETAIVTATTAVTTRGNEHTKEDQATKVNANCAATDDKTTARLVVGILSPLISLLSSSTSLASLTTRVSRQRQVFSHPGQPHPPCLKVKRQPKTRGLPTWPHFEHLARTV